MTKCERKRINKENKGKMYVKGEKIKAKSAPLKLMYFIFDMERIMSFGPNRALTLLQHYHSTNTNTAPAQH